MAILKINGEGIADPQTLTWDMYDLDGEEGAGRTQDGLLHRDRVAVKRKLNCTWGPLKPDEMAPLLQAMKDEFFELEYPDAYEGKITRGTFYVGDRSAPIYIWNGGKSLWEGLSANFIER